MLERVRTETKHKRLIDLLLESADLSINREDGINEGHPKKNLCEFQRVPMSFVGPLAADENYFKMNAVPREVDGIQIQICSSSRRRRCIGMEVDNRRQTLLPGACPTSVVTTFSALTTRSI